MIDNRKKIYVLTAHRDHEEYSSSTEVIGAYESLSDAQDKMQFELEKEKATWEHDYNIDMTDVATRSETMRATIFDNFGAIEYTEFEISVIGLTPSTMTM